MSLVVNAAGFGARARGPRLRIRRCHVSEANITPAVFKVINTIWNQLGLHKLSQVPLTAAVCIVAARQVSQMAPGKHSTSSQKQMSFAVSTQPGHTHVCVHDSSHRGRNFFSGQLTNLKRKKQDDRRAERSRRTLRATPCVRQQHRAPVIYVANNAANRLVDGTGSLLHIPVPHVGLKSRGFERRR